MAEWFDPSTVHINAVYETQVVYAVERESFVLRSCTWYLHKGVHSQLESAHIQDVAIIGNNLFVSWVERRPYRRNALLIAQLLRTPTLRETEGWF